MTTTTGQKRDREIVVSAVIWVIAAGVYFRNFWLSGFDAIIGDAGDARYDIFIRENFYQYVLGRGKFLSPPYFFPIRGTLGYSDAYLLDGLFYVPFRALGCDPFLSFELLIIATTLVGFVSFNLLLVRFGKVRQPLAALAAVLFTFSNALYIKVGHPQLLEVNWVPLVVLLVLYAARWHSERQIRTAIAGFAGGLILALLFSTGYYVSWYFTFTAFMALVATFLIRYGMRSIPNNIANEPWVIKGFIYVGAVFLIGFVIGIIPFIKIYVPVIIDSAGRPFDVYFGAAPIVSDVINVSVNNVLWGAVLDHLHVVPKDFLDSGEHNVAITPFVSLAFLVVVFLIWRGRILSGRDDLPLRQIIYGSFLAYVVMMVTMLRFDHFSLFWLEWHFVPGSQALRAGGRAQIALNFFVVAIVAIGLERLLRTDSRTLRNAIWVCVALFLLEQLDVVHSYNLSRSFEMASLNAVPSPPPACKSFIISRHTPERGDAIEQNDAILIAQHVHLPTLNGYPGGWQPSGWSLGQINEQSYWAKAWQWAKDHGITSGLCEYEFAERRWHPFSEQDVAERNLPAVTPGFTLNFDEKGNSAVYRGDGWSESEAPATWTDGSKADLATRVTGWPPGADMIMQVTGRPFLVADRHPVLAIDVVANGAELDRWSYRYDRDNDFVERSVRIPDALFASSPLRIEFRIEQPAIPSKISNSSDLRDLGLFVSRISFIPANGVTGASPSGK